MIDPLTFFRKGLFQIREAAYLELLARAGEDGLPLPVISKTMGEVTSTAHLTCRKLEDKGYVNAPMRKHTGKASANIWTISQAGRELIHLQTTVNLIK
jgi:DNA-binding MarR family transcriptional regulator